MKKHVFTKDQRDYIERMRLPFAVCQFLGTGVETLAVSDGFCELFGYQDREQAFSDMNQNMFRNIHPDDIAGLTRAVLRFGTEGGRLDELYRIKKMNSSGYKMIRLFGDQVQAEDGNRLAQLWFVDEGDAGEESGTDRKRAMEKELRDRNLINAARYDGLTGLPNMSFFFELAEAGRKELLAQGGAPALLYIDLQGMKHYNHKYGFSEGDKLLRYFARLLSQFFRPERCCHISGDRFAVFTDENGLEEKLKALFQKWLNEDGDRNLPIGVGIYPYRIEEVPVSSAYDRAKIACDKLKGIYSSSFYYYTHVLSEDIKKQQYILENIDLALSQNWIRVYYQPIIRAVNGKVCNEEALARWVDPVRGNLAPAEFVPYLEAAGLLYKLDLHVLERVLEHIRAKEAEGFYIVPHSINLSRSDFDACDMVEEIRQRVDEAGVSRDRICIEITESVIGSDFDFMKSQIERFLALGFPVWMDDFGSGYSSLDVLQSIKFSLLKFDMGFMQKLDESRDGRIILTEMMKMAMALGIDTICEGVETEDQVRFLQEIGCSKLQGFYFSKPMPFADILAYHRAHRQTGYENPEESEYYTLLCGVNLYDVSVIAREEADTLHNAYNTLPMCIIEVRGDSTRFVRSNQSYRDFFRRFFGMDLSHPDGEFHPSDAAFVRNVIKTCCEQGVRSFYDERMPDGSVVHAFARRISTNPVTGITAVAIAVLSIREPNEKLMVDQILSVIEQFGEQMPGGFFIYRADGNEELLYANKAVCDIFGCDSLEEFKSLTGFTFRGMVHPDDYEKISVSIEDQVKESQADLDYVVYRIIRKDGGIRWLDDYGHFIQFDDQTSLFYVFVSDITDRYEKAETDRAVRSAVIEALTKAYDSVWLITDMEEQKFELIRVDKTMDHFLPASAAAKIRTFSQAFAFYSKLVLEEDRQQFLEAVTPGNIVRNTESQPVYSVPFRRVFDAGIRYYRVEFAKLDLDSDENKYVVGFRNADAEGARYYEHLTKEKLENMRNEVFTNQKGAIDMEYGQFTRQYEYITNLEKRFSCPFTMIVITMEGKEGELLPTGEMEKAMSDMEQAILQTLRNVDVMTRYGSRQFLVILVGADPEGAEIAISRILRDYHKVNESAAIMPTYFFAQ